VHQGDGQASIALIPKSLEISSDDIVIRLLQDPNWFSREAFDELRVASNINWFWLWVFSEALNSDSFIYFDNFLV